MKIIAITQARTGSTRFPNKIMNKIGNETLLSIHINRIKKAKERLKILKSCMCEAYEELKQFN